MENSIVLPPYFGIINDTAVIILVFTSLATLWRKESLKAQNHQRKVKAQNHQRKGLWVGKRHPVRLGWLVNPDWAGPRGHGLEVSAQWVRGESRGWICIWESSTQLLLCSCARPSGLWGLSSSCVILVMKKGLLSLWKDFGSPNQGILSFKRDLYTSIAFLDQIEKASTHPVQ